MDWVSGGDFSKIFDGIPLKPSTSLEDLVSQAVGDRLDPNTQFPTWSGEKLEVFTVAQGNSKSSASVKQLNTKKNKSLNQSNPEESATEVTLKDAMFDVRTFTIRSLTGTEKESAEVQLAISLGAKPPKKKFLNYKELRTGKKLKKEADDEAKLNTVVATVEKIKSKKLQASKKKKRVNRK